MQDRLTKNKHRQNSQQLLINLFYRIEKQETRSFSTLSATTSKLGALWCSTLRHVTFALGLLGLGRHLSFLGLLFILGFLDPLLNFAEDTENNTIQSMITTKKCITEPQFLQRRETIPESCLPGSIANLGLFSSFLLYNL